MGWGSGNEIFYAVAAALVEADADDVTITHVCDKLIRYLRDEDWDTDREALEAFENYPPIVAAFRKNGIYRECGSRTWPDGYQRWCALERNHDGDHKEK